MGLALDLLASLKALLKTCLSSLGALRAMLQTTTTFKVIVNATKPLIG